MTVFSLQFLWRLGTVGARVISLTAYAAIYKYWVLLVLGLHWLSMLLWLHSPKNVFHGERMSPKRKAFLFALLAFVFTFEYVNLLENNHREKMVSTYGVKTIEIHIILKYQVYISLLYNYTFLNEKIWFYLVLWFLV